jgi:hypothetical protein
MIAWEAPCNRGPQEKADHGDLCGTCNHTRWSGALTSSARSGRDGVPAVRNNTGHRGLCPSHKVPMGGTASSRSARISGTQDHASPAPWPRCRIPCGIGQAGMGRILAVRKKRQPPVLVPNLQRDSIGRCPCELRQVGRDGVLAVRRNTGDRGLCPFPKVPWEGPRPRPSARMRLQ